MNAYLSLEKTFAKLYNYQHLLQLGEWDMGARMPPKGAEARGEAMAVMSKIHFDTLTAPQVRREMEEATAGQQELSEVQRANLREMRRQLEQMTVLPEGFVMRKELLTSRANVSWYAAVRKNDFPSFLPVLKELVALAREEAGYRVGKTGKSPYEALMGKYEPWLTVQRMDELVRHIKSWLPELFKTVVERQKQRPPVLPPKPPFDVKKQEALCHDMMRVWEFDFEAGRLDSCHKSFTGGVKEDCRITTRYDEKALLQSLFGVIHETGHAKYEMQCGPRAMLGQPVCNARSLGIHESQSLFAEFHVGRSRAFTEFLTPFLIRHFGEQPAFTVENMIRINQWVKPNYIRINADELSYPLHVILRYEIERDLIEGRMEAEDVPRAWNEKMKAYLGLETEGKDHLGCLQDMHWAHGAFGYFPTYMIGAIFASQMMHAIVRELGEEHIDDLLRRGELGPVLQKQKEKIWDHGCLYETTDLILRSTGSRLDPNYLRHHLEYRYLR